jgi:hypothetical protein
MEFTLSKKVQTFFGFFSVFNFSFRDFWFIFLPLSIISLSLFGVGAILYYSFLILRYKKLEKSETFILINRFNLSKYKKKYFFWSLFNSLRYASFSALTVFFKPMFYITIGIGIIFVGMMMQVNFIPYRKKFHNLMDYFILLSTLLTLFAGLLLFVVDRDGGASLVIDSGLQNFLKFSLPVITIFLIVVSNIVVISMFLFDVYIRRKKDKKKLKKKRKLEAEKMEQNQKMSNVLDDLHGRKMDHGDVVPWETEHDFKFTVNFEEEEEIEDTLKTMNDIMEDVFSFKRGRRKAFLIKRAGTRAASKMKRKMTIEPSQSINNDGVQKIEMSNGFVIKTQYKGNISLIEKSSK